MKSQLLPTVAIDGPAGAGESVIARRLAAALGFVHIDTGAIYRSVALAAQQRKIAWGDGLALGQLTREMVATSALQFQGGRVVLFGSDVTEAIRSVEISRGSSQVSVHAEVREALLALQRKLGEHGGVVLEGRDIGTVVFPNAEVKFFLTASPEVRAQRRYDEMVQKGVSGVTFDETLADVHARDVADTERAVAPLRQADDAILVDSTSMTIDETIDLMVEAVRIRS